MERAPDGPDEDHRYNNRSVGCEFQHLKPALPLGGVYGLTLTALDPFGNVANGYRGSASLTFSDPKACLPGCTGRTFTAGDNGSSSFGYLTLITTTPSSLFRS